MKNNEDFPYHNYKKQIASISDEITQYYYCNHNHRTHYLKYNKGKSYSSKNFGVKNTKTHISKMRDLILSNRNLKCNIKSKILNLEKDINYLFIDFEVIPSVPLKVETLDNIDFINGIYNIGIYIKTYDSEKFISLYSECLNDKKIVSDFINILNEYSKNNCYIYHWSSAEILFLKQYETKYNTNLNLHKYNFIDLYNIFIKNKIIIQGMKSFKLKEIANAIGIITKDNKNNNDKDVDDGMETIGLFLKDFINKNAVSKEKIQKYNENDCKYLFELLKIV
jgi:hypothetical protein